MTDIRMGNLVIGRLPRVVGTVSDRHTLRVPTLAAGPVCDVVEVRLDEVGCDVVDWLDRCAAIEAAGTPVLLTLRIDAEGGKWTTGDAAREPLLRRACERLAAIDIEAASRLRDPLCALAAERGKSVVVSFHDFERTPSLDALQRIVEPILAQPNAIPKVAAMIRDAADEAVLRGLLAWCAPRPLCVIGMGALGQETRVTFPAAGSCLSYGFLDRPCAPGQWPSAHLVERLRGMLPAYDADVVARKGVARAVGGGGAAGMAAAPDPSGGAGGA